MGHGGAQDGCALVARFTLCCSMCFPGGEILTHRHQMLTVQHNSATTVVTRWRETSKCSVPDVNTSANTFQRKPCIPVRELAR